ncbi:hypothetical protein GlitD10_2200 [Gloeomargarita lithophora Alchichica-D10]|uniref:Uncharacterized protein n=1 Tax=Gloeomargarita lithophora Alchichica-D10 TaxID=1188229 RepID=A0A1J0AF21_9CYAN|nr:hypothetical protein [Gloeomargarita lithophora]APB34529.1 hypothetical protein GlitD10_2200 [Gloeomargarita lithophora Alchichica-D10]
MPLANPLHYPLAMFCAALVLGVGVRGLALPRWLMFPVAVGIALGGSVVLQKRETQPPTLDDPVLAREIQQLRQQVQGLLQGAEKVRAEAARLLMDAPDLDLLITVQEVCDQVQTLPQALEQRVQKLHQNDEAVLSVAGLEKQLTQVRRQKRRVGQVAGAQLDQLEASLVRNIQLAQMGQDTRLAQVTALATLVQDTAGILQQLQNQLRSCDIHNQQQLQELRGLSETLQGFEEQMTILVTRA